MTELQKRALAIYCHIGRKTLLNFTDRFSCVAGTRLTIQTLKHFDLHFTPQPVKFAVTDIEANRVWSCGLSAEELSQGVAAVHKHEVEDGHGWSCHLVAISSDRRLILDSALDQADAGLNDSLGLRTVIYGFPITKPLTKHHFSYDAEAVSETGRNIRIQYAATDNDIYETSGAWNDGGLILLAEELCNVIRNLILPIG